MDMDAPFLLEVFEPFERDLFRPRAAPQTDNLVRSPHRMDDGKLLSDTFGVESYVKTSIRQGRARRCACPCSDAINSTKNRYIYSYYSLAIATPSAARSAPPPHGSRRRACS